MNRRSAAVAAMCSVCLICLGESAPAADGYAVRPTTEITKAYEGQKLPNVVTSEHFAIWYGGENPKNYPLDEKSFKEALDYCEFIRDHYVYKMGFPLRNSDGRTKYKTNVFLTETGLIPYPHGWAFGGPDEEGFGSFFGEPAIVTTNHNGAAHEFAHAMQGETGTFRDSEYVGWIWEAHAQFMAHQITTIPDLPHNAEIFIDTAQYDVSSTRHHYGAWIFLQYLAERPEYGVRFVNDLWLKPSSHQDEAPIAKMIRLAGMEDPGEWADLYGDFAKRMASFGTFKLGDEYLKCFNRLNERVICRSQAPLEQIKDRPGWYRIPYAFAPQQNAYNVIPLYPEARRVSVTFKGLVDKARKSDWRATLVAVDGNGRDRFSRTWNSGAESITLRPGEKLYLVVAATPGVLVHQPFQASFLDQERFPYEVKIRGAVPKGVGPEVMPGVEGSGFIADTAKVAPTAYVGPNARILDNAQILDNARVEDYAVIAGDAVVSGNAIVSGHAYVTDNAVISGNARVRDYARVYDTVKIDGNARVFEFPKLQRTSRVHGNAVVRGHAVVNGADVSGNALLTGGADPGSGVKCTKGVFTSWVGQRECDEAFDHGTLFAYYNFNSPHSFLVRDEFAGGDGIALGSPKWIPGQLGYLDFNGVDQYVDMPSHLSDLRDSEIEMNIKWLGSKADERVFDFGRDERNCMYLTPMAADTDKAAFVMVFNGDSVRIDAGDRLYIGDWYNVTLSFLGNRVTMKFGDEVIGTADLLAAPEALKATSNYLARGRNGVCFTGQVDSLTVRIKDE